MYRTYMGGVLKSTTAYTKTKVTISTSLDCEELVSSGGRHLQAGAATALSLS